MAVYRKNRPNNDEDGAEGASRKRPRWRAAARILVALLLIELGLLAAALIKLNSMGYFENLPIVKKIRTGETPKAPEGLEPAGNNGNTNVTGDEELDVNLQAGKVPIYAQDPIDKDVINILALGLDTRKPGGNGRSDMNMIISINRRDNTVKLASLLRDTLIPIEGHDWNRLNSAYAFGGPGLSINTVNEAYRMDIQRYVKLDFFAIQDIIDAVGGVDIKLTEKEVTYLRSYRYDVPPGAGVKHLNGVNALAYARIRKIDGDFQRTQRQRNVMTAVLGKARSMGVAKAIDLMTRLLPQVKTNINTNEALQLARGVLGMSGKEIRQITIPVPGSFENKKYKGMDIISVDFEKNANALKSFLYDTNK